MVFLQWHTTPPQDVGMQSHLPKTCGDGGAPDLVQSEKEVFHGSKSPSQIELGLWRVWDPSACYCQDRKVLVEHSCPGEPWTAELGSTTPLPSHEATSRQKLGLDSPEVLMENNSTMCYEFQESGFSNYILSNNYYLVIVIALSVCLHRENPFTLSRDSKWMCWFSLQSWATVCVFQ